MNNVLLIDNYDSFAYNVSRYIKQLGYNCSVVRNDKITINDITVLDPPYIIISPGPCTPNEAGVSLDLVKHLHRHYPILGICLGHQVIGQVFGGTIEQAKVPMHGRSSIITHKNSRLFKNIKSPIKVGRYHSLIVNAEKLSNDICVTAVTDEHEIMAIEHKSLPLYGVQFHPESILTECGYEILNNFLTISGHKK